MASNVTLKDLLESGAHFGHQTRKWNPRMKEYIFIARGGIHIIDLQKTLKSIEVAYDFLRSVAASGRKVLFVATKKQARLPVQEAATAVGMPYVTERWLGGMLTNFQTISKSIQKLDDIEKLLAGPGAEVLPKKEAISQGRAAEKLRKNLGGIREMERLPGALFVIDTTEELIAVKEANKLHIPVVGVVDTNADPFAIDYPIPGNDDAIRSILLFVKVAKDAISDGLSTRSEGAAEVEMVSPERRTIASVEAVAAAPAAEA
jgi:small subunit ribosomal protein S2